MTEFYPFDDCSFLGHRFKSRNYEALHNKCALVYYILATIFFLSPDIYEINVTISDSFWWNMKMGLYFILFYTIYLLYLLYHYFLLVLLILYYYHKIHSLTWPPSAHGPGLPGLSLDAPHARLPTQPRQGSRIPSRLPSGDQVPVARLGMEFHALFPKLPFQGAGSLDGGPPAVSSYAELHYTAFAVWSSLQDLGIWSPSGLRSRAQPRGPSRLNTTWYYGYKDGNSHSPFGRATWWGIQASPGTRNPRCFSFQGTWFPQARLQNSRDILFGVIGSLCEAAALDVGRCLVSHREHHRNPGFPEPVLAWFRNQSWTRLLLVSESCARPIRPFWIQNPSSQASGF